MTSTVTTPPATGAESPSRPDTPAAAEPAYTPWLAYGCALVAFAAYATWSVSRYQRFADRSYDLSIFSQAVNAYAHFRAPISPVKGLNLLGDHFSPGLAALAPLYRLFPTPVTLQIAQAFLLALAGVPIMRAAQRSLGRWPGAAIGVSYFLAWGTQTALDSDFHAICLAVPLLAFALEALLAGRWTAAIAWSVPLVLVKEDLGLTVAALGVVLAIRGQRRGLHLAAFGAGSFAVTVGLLIPAISPTHRYPYWSKIGPPAATSPGPWLAQLAHLPTHLLSPAPKLSTLFLLAVITGFACLRSTITLLAIPTLLWRFLSNNPSYWGHAWQYDVVLMPILFAALIDAAHRGQRSQHPWLRVYAGHVPAVALAVGLLLCTQFPLRALTHQSTYQPAADAAAAHQVINAIPDGASVETDIGVMTQLIAHHLVYWVGTPHNPAPDYLLVDATGGWSPAPPDAASYAEQAHPGTTYEDIADIGGLNLAKRINTQ